MSEKDLVSIDEAIEQAEAKFNEEESKRINAEKQSDVAEPEKKEEGAEGSKEEDETKEPEKKEEGVEGSKEEGAEADKKPEEGAEDDIPDADLQPLNQWDDTLLETFNNLPTKKDKKVMLDTFKGFQRGYGKKAEKLNEERRTFEKSKRLGEDVSEILKPISNKLKMRGATEAMFLSQMVEVFNMLEDDPQNAIKEIAHMYQVDPAVVAMTEAEKSPELIRQEQLLREQRQQMSQRENRNLAIQEANHKIQAFKSATNTDGTLKYPEFDKVENQMAQLHQQTGETDLEKLYTSATNANPEILQKNLESKIEQQVQDRLKAEMAKLQSKSDVQKAKAASVDIQGERSSKNSEAHKSKKVSLDDAINSVLDS